MSEPSPRIYVACLHCYNSGRLHGEWFDVSTDPGTLHHEIQGHFATGCATCDAYEPDCPECRAFTAPFPCGGEELAIHDHQDLGPLGEFLDLVHVCGVASLLEDLPDRPVLEFLNEDDASDLERARQILSEDYAGSWDSLADWAEAWAEDLDLDAEQLWPYVDWVRFAREQLRHGHVTQIRVDGEVHVFVGS